MAREMSDIQLSTALTTDILLVVLLSHQMVFPILAVFDRLVPMIQVMICAVRMICQVWFGDSDAIDQV
jgi:hypothetical protein